MWKRSLDLNGPGSKLVAWAVFFLIVLPLFLYCSSLLLGLIHIHIAVPGIATKISLLVAGVLLAVLAGLLVVEGIQDYLYHQKYLKGRSKKIKLSIDLYECQYCGCRQVKGSDRQCPICGKELC